MPSAFAPSPLPRARGLAPGPQAGGQCRAVADLLPRLIVRLKPWPSTETHARWLRPARSGVPTPNFPEPSVRRRVAQPMLAHHPDRRSATGRGGWLCPTMSRVLRRPPARYGPPAWGWSGGGSRPLRRGARGAEPARNTTHRAGGTGLGQSPKTGCRGRSPPAFSPTVQVVLVWGRAPRRGTGAAGRLHPGPCYNLVRSTPLRSRARGPPTPAPLQRP